MRVTVQPAASAELGEAARFYADRADQALGLAFIAEFERALSLLSINPELGALWRGTARRYPLRRFPYNVVYQIRRAESDCTGASTQTAKLLERTTLKDPWRRGWDN